MEAKQTANPPSFESVWAALQETNRILKETTAKWQEETAKRQKETDRQLKKSAARLDKQLGKLGNRMGEVIEHMVAPNLRKKFRKLGYDFPQANTNSDVSDSTNKIYLEIDVKLENGDKVMLVEVKTKPTAKDVKDHIKPKEW